MRRAFVSIGLCLVTASLAAVTFLALWETNQWWVRMTDFPRLQYAIALVVLLGLLALARPASLHLRAGLAALALLALGYNSWKLAPYIPGGEVSIARCAPGRQISIMVANVKLENRHAGALLEIVRDRDPDILIALETTEWWDRQLSALSDEMPYSVARITGSYFGMRLLSRLPLGETKVVFPVDQDTPAILATAALPSGEAVRLIGLHPRPPHPGQSSLGRDAQLMWAALKVRSARIPVALAGDLNAVPWERGVERLQRIGRLIDPRRITGFQPTYDARSWWMAWPLDQVLHQGSLGILSMEVLPYFGSDHYPVEVTLCHRPAELLPPDLRPDDLDEARATIAAALQGAAERP